MTHEELMLDAINYSREMMHSGAGGPFGAIIVKNGKIIAKGCNRVTSTNDPTAHAEIVAIREATQKLQDFSLKECILYTSCEPCPMCLSAIYWARIAEVYYANTRTDAAEIQFDDSYIYDQVNTSLTNRDLKFTQICRSHALPVFKEWTEKKDKIQY